MHIWKLSKNKSKQLENVPCFGFGTICIICGGALVLVKLQTTLFWYKANSPKLQNTPHVCFFAFSLSAFTIFNSHIWTTIGSCIWYFKFQWCFFLYHRTTVITSSFFPNVIIIFIYNLAFINSAFNTHYIDILLLKFDERVSENRWRKQSPKKHFTFILKRNSDPKQK